MQIYRDRTDEPIKAIAELVFKQSLLYGGVCFGGCSKPMASVLKLNAANLFLDMNPEFHASLDHLKAKIAKKIGCSKTFFKFEHQTMIVHSAGAEVARHKDTEMAPNQFGTLFIQPPSTHTGGEMKVYRKLGADKDEEEINLKFGANSEASACKWQFGFISAEAEYEFAPILSGSRLMLVFAAVWSSDQDQSHGPEQIDQIVTQLEIQRANGDFVADFLRDSYKNLEGIGERALKHADRSLVRLLKAANERLERPFKVALVSVAKYEWEKAGEYEELEWNSPGEFEQRWFDLDGNPWPYSPKAKLELMENVLNPERKPLHELWGPYVEKQLREIPTMDYDVLRAYSVTFRRTLLVLWYSDLTIERMADLEGWDAAFKTLIGKSPDSAALVSLLQLFKKKTNGIHYTTWRDETNGLLENDTIRLIYDYIAQKSLLDVLPSYIVAFFNSKVAFMPIILTSNEEMWKISLPVLSNLDYVDPFYIAGLLKKAQEEQAPEERCRKVLLEVIKSNRDGHRFATFALHETLALADEALMTTICEILVQKRLLGHYLKEVLLPEFAPLKEKFWPLLYSMLEQRIEALKDVKGEELQTLKKLKDGMEQEPPKKKAKTMAY